MDDILVQRLREVLISHRGQWRAKYLLALVHLERGDVDAAVILLEEALQQMPGEKDVQEALRLARSGGIPVGRYLRTLYGGPSTDSVYSASLSADGRLALSGGGDRTVWLVEVSKGRGRLWGSWLWWLAESTLSEMSSGRWQLEEATRGSRYLRTFDGHTNDVLSVSLSADGRLALSGGGDRTVRLWEVATGQCLRTFEGHTGGVDSVSLSADGRLALSGGRDDTVRLWEVATGRCLRTFEGHTGGVFSVSLSADGRLALSGSKDQTVQLWEVEWELEARDPVGWDEGARPYLKTFLTLHMPYGGVLPQDREPSKEEIQQALTRHGKPTWTEEDFQQLIQQLQYAGYGWLRPEGVRRELEKIAAKWESAPPLPGV